MIELRDWQKECYHTLQEHDFNGVIKVASGQGKTVLAIYIINELIKKNKNNKALIVVPTINLMVQWAKEFETFAPHITTSFLYGRKRDQSGQVIISVINTASKTDFTQTFAIKVLDEIHHYGAEIYAQIFSIKTLHTIGLSATPLREDEGDLAIRYGAGNIVYSFDNLNELKKRFTAFTIRTPLSPQEFSDYSELQSEYKRILAITGYHVEQIVRKGKRGDKFALRILKIWSQQARIRHNAQAKIPIIRAILHNEQGQKIIIFSESIAFTEQAAKKLGIIAVHSHMQKDEVIKRLNTFRKATSATLIAPRLIDEGYDVPNANVAIIASFTRSPRQMIQRDGRILRTQEPVRRYALVIEGVEEDKYFSILKRTNTSDIAKKGLWLRYDNGFVEDSQLRVHFEDYLENETEGYDEYLTKKLDLARSTQRLDHEFYHQHKASIDRLASEHPKRWPMLESPQQQIKEFFFEYEADEKQKRVLKQEVRMVHQRILLPDEFFNALMRIIDSEKFVMSKQTQHYFKELAKENKLNWPQELFKIIKAVAKKL